MIYSWLADLVLVLHLAFILFVVGGGLLALRWRRAPWVHLPLAAWGALVEFTGWICPLTPLEQWLRRAGGATSFEEGFIEHYLLPIVYPAGLTREVQLVLGGAVVVVNVWVYAVVWRRARVRSASDQPS